MARITRADKIRMAQEAAAADDRDPKLRDAARQEWSQVRRAAREAFLAKGDWNAILNAYRDKEGFYTPDERAKMCSDYANELIMNGLR